MYSRDINSFPKIEATETSMNSIVTAFFKVYKYANSFWNILRNSMIENKRTCHRLKFLTKTSVVQRCDNLLP